MPRRVAMSKCAKCEELKELNQDLQKENKKLTEKCADKAAEMRDLEARTHLENSKLKQELKRKEEEMKRLKPQKSAGAMWTELQQTKVELAKVRSEASSKTCCKDKELEIQRLKQELTRFKDTDCMRPDCAKVRSDNKALKLEVSQLNSEPCTKKKCREITSENTNLYRECNQLHIQFAEGQRKVDALKDRLTKEEAWATTEIHQKVEALDQCRAQQKRLESKNEELTKEVERLESDLQHIKTKLEEDRRNEKERLQSELEQLAESSKEQEGRLKNERVEELDECRKQQKRLESKNEELTKEVERLESDLQHTKTKLEEDCRNEKERLQSELEQLAESSKKQERRLESKNEELTKEVERLESDLQHTKTKLEEDRRNEKERLQSELEQLAESSKEQEGRMLSEKDELNREIGRLNTLTCQGKDCPSQYLRIVRSDISDAIGKAEYNQTAAFRDMIASLESSLCEKLHLQQSQEQSYQNCAVCSEKERVLQNSKNAYHQLQTQTQKFQEVIKSHEKTIHDLNRQLYSGQCQRQECVQLRREKRQAAIKKMGDPGKDLDKQRVVEHDQLIHEFEKLTSDPDGLLGVLEDTLHEYGDDANFEAKRLLCALFQESYDNCRKAAIHEVRAQLEYLFAVQPKKTEEMEDASRGYGLLLHAFHLRTKEMRDQYSALIKKKMQKDILSDETLQKVEETLERSDEDYLGKVIELAWKFVTLPNPLIVCQPKEFDSQTLEPQYGRWDKHAKEPKLIYLRPVVYRNYEGALACKGWVANTSQQRAGRCVLS